MITVNNPIELEKERVLDRIGYGQAANPSPRIVSMVEDYVEHYHDFVVPSYSYVVRPVLGGGGKQTDIGASGKLESAVLARLMTRCEYAIIFAMTIGDYLEQISAQLSQNNMVLQSTVLDAIGSGAVEKFAAIFQETVNEMAAARRMVASRRFSPGYCDWDVSQQTIIFDALGDDTAGVELTANMLMMPRKSISGIIGIGQPGRDIEKYNPCTTCGKRDCPGRRK
jgi:hypothetical protein